MNKKLKITIIIGIIIIVLSVAYYYKTALSNKEAAKRMQEAEQQEAAAAKEASEAAQNKTIEEELLEYSEETNKSLPEIDESGMFEITITSAVGKEITLFANVIGKGIISQKWLDKIKNDMGDAICIEPEFKYYLEKGAIFTLNFLNKDGTFGGKVSFDSLYCEKSSSDTVHQ